MKTARPPRCSRCKDNRWLAKDARYKDYVPCPECGSKTESEYLDFIRAHERAHAAEPEICELDLTPKEFAVFRRLQAEHPTVAKKTVLAWMEARRYNPGRDPDCVEEVDRLLATWRLEQHARARELGREWGD